MNFPTWKTVKIGNLHHGLYALGLLRAAQIKYSSDVKWRLLLELKDAFIQFPHHVDLVLASPRELGVTSQITGEQFRKSVAAHGLSICAPEVAIALLLQEPNLAIPKMQRGIFMGGQQLHIAMEPITLDGINPLWFTVSDHCMSVAYGSHYDIHDEDPLVFVRN